MLTALLPLGPKLVEMLPNEHKLLIVFKEYFNSCVMLAGRQSERGHLLLVEAATQWLPNWYVHHSTCTLYINTIYLVHVRVYASPTVESDCNWDLW